jgi:heme oxygenase (biliverdin-producing, ferredoxin)
MTHLSTQLREGTQASHTLAENTAYMKCFLKGIVEREPFRKLIANLYFVYSTLEVGFEQHKNHEIIGRLYRVSARKKETKNVKKRKLE